MANKDIVFALKLDKRDYDQDMASAKENVEDLNNTSLSTLSGNIKGIGRELKTSTAGFDQVQKGAKASAKELAAMEKQAGRTSATVGKMSMAERLGGRLAGISKVTGIAGHAASGIGGAAVLGGMFQKWRARVPEGVPPPPPGSAGAARRAALMASGERLSKFGGKVGTAGTVLGAVSGVAGMAPGIAGLLGSSKSASGGVAGLSKAVAGFSGNASKAAQSSGTLAKSFGGIRAAAGGVVGIAAGVTAGVAAMGGGLVAAAASGLGLNSSLEQSKAQFEVFTGSALKADAIIGALSKRADVTPFNTKEYIEGGASLMSAAQGSKDKLMELMKTAEMLTVVNRNEGLTGAAVAMKNALSGDFTSLQDRFNIAPSTVAKYKEMGLSGQELIRTILGTMNVTEQSVEKLGSTWEGRKSTVLSFIDNIRTKLSGALFEWLRVKMGGAVEWIEKNQQWVLDTASGLGTMIGGMFVNAGTKLYEWWQTAQMIGLTAYEFVTGLKDKIVESFNNGTLLTGILSGIGNILGAASLLAFEALKLIGNFAWNGLINGTPALIGIIGKMVTDALTKAYPSLSKMIPGLDTASEAFGDMAKRSGDAYGGKAKEDFANWASKSKELISGAAMVGGDMMQSMGLDEAKERAAEKLAPSEEKKEGFVVNGFRIRPKRSLQGPSGPPSTGLFSPGGILAQANARGAEERAAKEKAQAGIYWEPVKPEKKRATIEDEMEAEKYNAGVQNRKARNKEQVKKLMLVTQQNTHAVAMH